MSTYAIAMWIGYGVMSLGGIALLCVMLWLGIEAVDYFGKKLWNKLLALYDLHTLRAHLAMLEVQGKTLRKMNSPAAAADEGEV